MQLSNHPPTFPLFGLQGAGLEGSCVAAVFWVRILCWCSTALSCPLRREASPAVSCFILSSWPITLVKKDGKGEGQMDKGRGHGVDQYNVDRPDYQGVGGYLRENLVHEEETDSVTHAPCCATLLFALSSSYKIFARCSYTVILP